MKISTLETRSTRNPLILSALLLAAPAYPAPGQAFLAQDRMMVGGGSRTTTGVESPSKGTVELVGVFSSGTTAADPRDKLPMDAETRRRLRASDRLVLNLLELEYMKDSLPRIPIEISDLPGGLSQAQPGLELSAEFENRIPIPGLSDGANGVRGILGESHTVFLQRREAGFYRLTFSTQLVGGAEVKLTGVSDLKVTGGGRVKVDLEARVDRPGELTRLGQALFSLGHPEVERLEALVRQLPKSGYDQVVQAASFAFDFAVHRAADAVDLAAGSETLAWGAQTQAVRGLNDVRDGLGIELPFRDIIRSGLSYSKLAHARRTKDMARLRKQILAQSRHKTLIKVLMSAFHSAPPTSELITRLRGEGVVAGEVSLGNGLGGKISGSHSAACGFEYRTARKELGVTFSFTHQVGLQQMAEVEVTGTVRGQVKAFPAQNRIEVVLAGAGEGSISPIVLLMAQFPNMSVPAWVLKPPTPRGPNPAGLTLLAGAGTSAQLTLVFENFTQNLNRAGDLLEHVRTGVLEALEGRTTIRKALEPLGTVIRPEFGITAEGHIKAQLKDPMDVSPLEAQLKGTIVLGWDSGNIDFTDLIFDSDA